MASPPQLRWSLSSCSSRSGFERTETGAVLGPRVRESGCGAAGAPHLPASGEMVGVRGLRRWLQRRQAAQLLATRGYPQSLLDAVHGVGCRIMFLFTSLTENIRYPRIAPSPGCRSLSADKGSDRIRQHEAISFVKPTSGDVVGLRFHPHTRQGAIIRPIDCRI